VPNPDRVPRTVSLAKGNSHLKQGLVTLLLPLSCHSKRIPHNPFLAHPGKLKGADALALLLVLGGQGIPFTVSRLNEH
jgi:hypothetical protein